MALLLVSGCGKLRHAEGPTYCPDFEKDIAPLAQAKCVSCHGAALAEGGWRADSYLEAVKARDDGTLRVVPRSAATSPVVQAGNGTLANHPDPALDTGELEDLTAWVACGAPGRRFAYHPNGWANPGDAEQFHGKALRKLVYDTKTCRGCHGEDLKGGKAEVSCYQCHLKGPDDCSTCHGDATSAAPPRAVLGQRTTSSVGVGAHRAHLKDTALHAAYDCTVCHVTPKAPGDEGHYAVAGKLDELPAEVTVKSAPGLKGEWEHEHQTCERTACHAPYPDQRATNQAPTWTAVGKGEAACGTCHGLPPSNHVDDRCEGCHSRVYAQGAIIDPALHANGTVEVGDGSGECTNCHGDATSPAPPRDLAGLTDETRISVGAHRAHLFAHRFRGPIACDECHLVPKKPMDVGHIDTAPPAEVFPFADGVGQLARTDAARPTWEHGSGTCANVYCHGGGARAARDTTPGLLRTLLWVGPSTSVRCGGCHGLPPKDNFHATTLTLGDCATCHFDTMEADGGLKLEATDAGVVTFHLDGQVQLGGAPKDAGP